MMKIVFLLLLIFDDVLFCQTSSIKLLLIVMMQHLREVEKEKLNWKSNQTDGDKGDNHSRHLYLTLFLILMSHIQFDRFRRWITKRHDERTWQNETQSKWRTEKNLTTSPPPIIFDCCFDSFLWLFLVHFEMIAFNEYHQIDLLVMMMFFSVNYLEEDWVKERGTKLNKLSFCERSLIQRINNTSKLLCH